MRVIGAGSVLFALTLGGVDAQAATHATTSASTSHSQSTAKPATSFVFCKTTSTPQYYSAVFESSTWNHAAEFQSYVAKQYNRGSQAALCYPRATKEQAQKYMDQLVASARGKVPEDAPKREVVVLTKWSPPATQPKPATTPAAATASPAATTSGAATPTGAAAAQAHAAPSQ